MGHSDKGMVRSGQVREMDRVGNDSAYEAAGFERRRVHERVIDARRHLWYLWCLAPESSGSASVLHCHCKGYNE